MEYKVFYRKYRPDSFKNIIGQDYSKTMLQNAIKNDKISHAYIFTGPRGTGKTSTAKVFAKAINCENPVNGEACGACNSCINFLHSSDIIEIDAASNNGVDEIRELINNVKIAPTNSKYKIYIIDEVHMMTSNAFNALLLTLEEPPAHVIFIMATTNIESVPITILSRCQRFDFKKFDVETLKNQIIYVCKQEKIEISDEAATEIAYISEGGMRDALSLLDQLSSSSQSITIEDVLTNYGSISSVFVKSLVNDLLKNDINSVISQFDILKDSSSDYKIFIKKLIQELISYAIRLKTEYVKEKFTYEQVKDLIFELNECMNRTNININPYILIELVVLNYMNMSQKEVLKLQENEEKSANLVDLSIKPESFIEEESMISKDCELDNLNKLKKIRVNNCFCGAKKELLNDFKVIWQEIAISPIPDDILNLLIDTNLVASSDTNVIIETKLDSTALLINKRIDEIGDYLCDFLNHELKFIALCEEEWFKEKKKYITNIKSGKSYQFQEEFSQITIEKKEESISNIEKIAQDLFEHDKIEII